MLVPREMKLEHSGGVKAMTDEQLERSIEILKEMIAQRDAAASAKVIEGEAEVVPPAPGSGQRQKSLNRGARSKQSPGRVPGLQGMEEETTSPRKPRDLGFRHWSAIAVAAVAAR
ncbi:MAG TPA: hypothetical protein VKL40_13600, partial [Candidatus Angelobacter sp.]|nr:hypothetical protein [Candidatus Angelobacter sp.]